jgi:hypothetical protein
MSYPNSNYFSAKVELGCAMETLTGEFNFNSANYNRLLSEIVSYLLNIFDIIIGAPIRFKQVLKGCLQQKLKRSWQ